MFWLASYPTNFHETIENLKCNSASHKYNDYLLERQAFNVSLHERDKHVSLYSNVLVKTSGFFNQLEKVCFDSSVGDRTFGAKN